MKMGMPRTPGEAIRIHVKAFLRSTMLSGIVGAAYLSSNPAHAQAIESARPSWIDPSWYAPAVDGVNGRIEGFGGPLTRKASQGSRERSRFLWEGNGASSLMEGPARWTTGHSRAASDVCFGETPFAACSAPMSATLTGTSTVACRRLRRQANSRHIGAGGVRSHVAVIVAHFTPAVRAL